MGISTKALDKAMKCLISGGVGILPTDTLYGLVGSALRKKTVSRIYRLRRRMAGKPMIVLIADANDIARFNIRPNRMMRGALVSRWPGKVSIVLPCRSEKFTYLHRGTRTIAFRVPRPKWLREILRAAGPLVAPSANIQGMFAALTVRDAKKVFGKQVDFYVGAGRMDRRPSKVIKIVGGKIITLRK